jgi:hypothetical protein
MRQKWPVYRKQCIHRPFPSHNFPAYTPPFYTQAIFISLCQHIYAPFYMWAISISLCPHIYTTFLYTGLFHPIIPLHMHHLSIHGPFSSHYATAYTPLFYMWSISISLCPHIYTPLYTRAISISLFPCIYTLFLYTGS